MSRYHVMIPCHDIMTRYTMSRYHVTIPCHETMSRNHVTIPCHDTMSLWNFKHRYAVHMQTEHAKQNNIVFRLLRQIIIISIFCIVERRTSSKNRFCPTIPNQNSVLCMLKNLLRAYSQHLQLFQNTCQLSLLRGKTDENSV